MFDIIDRGKARGIAYLNMDYVFFFYGLSFFVLGAICFFLRQETGETPAWRWLGLFALTHGINEWLDMFAFIFTDNPVFSAVRLAVMALSFVFLLESGRRTLQNAGTVILGRWIYAPLLLLAVMGGYYGFNGFNASARYALGFTGGVAVCLGFYRAAAGKPAPLRAPLLAISAGLGLYALASGAVTPQSAFIPACWLNYEKFSAIFGFPVQLLRGLLALFIALSAWIYLLNLGKAEGARVQRKGQFGWGVMAALLISLAGGWLVTDALGNRANTALVHDSENMERILYNRLSVSLWVTDQAVASMSGAPWIIGALAAGDAQSVTKGESVLARYCESFEFSICYLLNLKGVAIASTNRSGSKSLIGNTYGFRPYFKEAASGRPGSYFALGVTTGERGYYASYPVRAAGGRLVGVAVIKKTLDFLSDDLQLFKYSFLVSPEGVILVASQPEMAFSNLWPVSAAGRASLSESKQFGALSFAPLLKAELRDDNLLNFAGDSFHVSRVPLKQDGWSLVIFHSRQPVRMARFSGILLTFALCVLLLGFFVALLESETAREAAEKMLKLKEEIKTLTGILPICAGCKKIRDDQGDWCKVEAYVAHHTQVKFSHGLCPECSQRLYPEYQDDTAGQDGKKAA